MRKLFSGNVNLTAGAMVLIGAFDVSECESVGIDLTNRGSAPLTAFEIRGRASPDGDFVVLANSGFTTAGWWTRWASVDPTTLAAGASSMVQLTVEELSTVQVFAKSAVGTTLMGNVVAWEHAR